MSRARHALGLEAAITKLDKYQLLILDDIAYVTKDHAETGVLFELIATRYERPPFSAARPRGCLWHSRKSRDGGQRILWCIPWRRGRFHPRTKEQRLYRR